MSSLVDATAALSVTDERPDALAPAPPTCVPSDNSHSSPPGIAAARVTRRRFDAEPGVHIKLDKRGDGVAPVEGDTVQVNYSGRVKGKKTEFDKNDGGYPFEFTLGERKVVAGWESAVPKLRVGDHATLTLAPEFGYGETGDSDDIPPNATLIFKVESGVRASCTPSTRRPRAGRARRNQGSYEGLGRVRPRAPRAVARRAGSRRR